MEGLSKLAVATSVLVALVLEVQLASRAWGPLRFVTIAAFASGVLAERVWRRRVPAVSLAIGYFVPALFMFFLGQPGFWVTSVWTAALLGAILATTDRRGWAFPFRWKAPLVLWALTIAIAWPLIVARELDYTPALWGVDSVANTGGGASPSAIVVWVVDVAVAQGLGLLWFDWLCHSFDREPEFRRRVLQPILLGAILASLVGIYQYFVDITFVSGSVWVGFHRAAGSMYDGNAFGMVMALSAGVLLALALWRVVPPWLAVGGLVLLWGGLWASASRTALIVGATGLGASIYASRAVLMRALRSRYLSLWSILAGAIAIGVVLAASSSRVNPVHRLVVSLPAPSPQAFHRFAVEMWARGGLGTAATRMIEEHPLVGVGIGAFNSLSSDYTAMFAGFRGPMDNAQNWYRHELAEYGILGSLGWMLWVISFGWFLIRSRAAGDRRSPGPIVKATLVALGVVSAVGMPTQNAAVLMTVWALIFWWVRLAGDAGDFARRPLSGWTWLAMGVVLVLFVAGTARLARADLRVPNRALRADWDYAHGFYDLERIAPTGGAFRWTEQTAVAVFPAPRRYLKLTFWVHHPDASRRPVEVKIWQGEPAAEGLILDMTFSKPAPVTAYVRVPDGQHRMMLETWVSRTFQPIAFGVNDPRDLGLEIEDWTFTDTPPPGAMVITKPIRRSVRLADSLPASR